MAYPAGVITRPVTFGPAFELEDGDTAGMQVTFKATRPGVLWLATGSPAVSTQIVRNANDGAEQTVNLPVTDQEGWGDGDGNVIDPGEDGNVFLYIVTVIFTQDGRTIAGAQPRSKVVAVPQGDGSPLDLDKLLPLTSPGGTVVSVPDIWSEQIAAAEAAAVAAAESMVDSDAFIADRLSTPGTASEVALTAKIETATADLSNGPLPFYLDAYNKFFGEANVFAAGQGTTSTTTPGAASGSTTLPVASGTGLVNGTVLVVKSGTAQQGIHRVTAGGGTTSLTVTPALGSTLAAGAVITPLWSDNGHLNGAVGWGALAYFITHAQRPDGSPVIKDPGAKPIVFLGNSWMTNSNSAYADAVHALYPSATVIMAGISGNNSAQQLARFDTAVPSDAAYVVIAEPSVNSAASETRQQWAANLETLIAKTRAIGATPVYVGPVPLSDFAAISKQQATDMAGMFADPKQFPAATTAALDTRYQQKTASGSTAYGINALRKDTAGSNTGFGSAALSNCTSGASNVGIGRISLASLVTGNANTAVGDGTAVNLTSGNNNAFFGASSGQLVTTGSRLVGVGDGTIAAATTANNLTAVGQAALAACTASGVTAVGQAAGKGVTTGGSGVYIGVEAGSSPAFDATAKSTTAVNQTFVGAYSGQKSATQVNGVVGLGASAQAGAADATALGASSQALHARSVALGNGATTTAADQVMVGPRDVEITDAAKGLVLKSPDGTRYRVTVANGGTLSVAPA
jgi:uncharacterized cupin superfamily protein